MNFQIFFDGLKIRLHKHFWVGSAWNPYGFEHEQCCASCGAYRHQYFTESLDKGPWIDGEHPKAREMRAYEQSKSRG